jgi:hypothetical protein
MVGRAAHRAACADGQLRGDLGRHPVEPRLTQVEPGLPERLALLGCHSEPLLCGLQLDAAHGEAGVRLEADQQVLLASALPGQLGGGTSCGLQTFAGLDQHVRQGRAQHRELGLLGPQQLQLLLALAHCLGQEAELTLPGEEQLGTGELGASVGQRLLDLGLLDLGLLELDAQPGPGCLQCRDGGLGAELALAGCGDGQLVERWHRCGALGQVEPGTPLSLGLRVLLEPLQRPQRGSTSFVQRHDAAALVEGRPVCELGVRRRDRSLRCSCPVSVSSPSCPRQCARARSSWSC